MTPVPSKEDRFGMYYERVDQLAMEHLLGAR
jgi:hypothetical protein